MPEAAACLICKQKAQVEAVQDAIYGLALLYECEICGCFIIPRLGSRLFPGDDEQLLPFLSAHTRQESFSERCCRLDVQNWKELALGHKTTAVSKKLDLTLKLVADRSMSPGSVISASMNDYPLVDAMNGQELRFYVDQLKESGYLDLVRPLEGNKFSCRMTAKGWDRFQAFSVSGIPGRCFVAMSFDPSLSEAWEKGIYLALKIDCELDPIRIDKEQHNEKICDKIIAEIRLSQFLVADFTLHRQGVYFEAGFALGLGRPVIWMCREDDLEKAHFDTRQYNHIVWTTHEDLRTKLRDRVIATITKKD
jgi:hypothetical protein